MDTVDRIEKLRFLGRELLVWLWFESEISEGRIELPGFARIELFLEQQLTLADGKEKSSLRGAAPSAWTEAREALRQGKLPVSAKFKVELGEAQYSFVLQADTLGLAGVRLPAIDKGEGDDPAYDRMARIEELDDLVLALFGAFAALRLSPLWDSEILPAVKAWVRGEGVDADRYARARFQALAKSPAKRRAPASTPPPALPVPSGTVRVA